MASEVTLKSMLGCPGRVHCFVVGFCVCLELMPNKCPFIFLRKGYSHLANVDSRSPLKVRGDVYDVGRGASDNAIIHVSWCSGDVLCVAEGAQLVAGSVRPGGLLRIGVG